MGKRKILNIVGKKYTLTFMKSVLKYKETDPDTGKETISYAYGDCNSVMKKIRICDEVSKEEKFDTLVHEMLHALDDELGLEMTHEQVRLLATNLADTLVRNKLININL